MEVHSHGVETLGVNKDADKVYNPELKDILPPISSQIPAGENFTVPPPSENPSDIHVSNEDANNSVGVDSNALPSATFSFPPESSDPNSTPDINFQPFESVGGEHDPQNPPNSTPDINFQPFESVGGGHNPGEQDAAFDDMVILENDMVTAASLSGDTFHVSDIQIEGFHPAPMSDIFDAPSVAADATVVEVNVGETTEHPASAQAAEASVTVISEVTVISAVVQEVSVMDPTEMTAVEAAHDFPSSVEDGVPAEPTSDGVEAKVPEVTDAAEILNATGADGDTAQKSEPGGASHEVTDEEIQAIKGQKVVKKFQKKYYAGEVVDFDPETKWFKVVYEDGDDEDLEMWEVKDILASSSNASSSKKRPRTEEGADGSSQKSSKKSKKTVAGSTAKKSRTGSKSAAKSPKTPGTKAKVSKSAKKSSASKRARSPGKLIKKALNSSAFKTPVNSGVKEGKGKGKAGTHTPGTHTPKSTKGGSAKKIKSGKVTRSLNLQSPKTEKKGKDKASVVSSSSKKVTKSAGLKRKAEQAETSMEKSKRSKKAVTEVGGDTDLIGKQVKKDFDGTLYDGTVVKFDKKTKFYKVKYADGDQEDLELHELEAILVQDLGNTEEIDDKPAKSTSLASLMSAEKKRQQSS